MATITNNFKNYFQWQSILSNLIAINIIVFLIIKIISFFDSGALISWLELPAEINQLAVHPWSVLTYFFTHTQFLHILFNLLWLYWFGKIFLLFFTPRQLGGLYVLGGIFGGILFILSYNLIPYFSEYVSSSYLIGASASIMAIVFAAAFYKKDFEVGLLFIGNIKIIYLALICLLSGILPILLADSGQSFNMQNFNFGGQIAHIGGALTGIWFAESLKRGKDITRWINTFMDFAVNLFKKKPAKKMRVQYKRPESDYDYNARRNASTHEIDRILDKIKRSGYNSLSSEEKKILFDASNK